MNAKGDANHSVRLTKRRLSAALMTLMQQKPVQNITVWELTQQAKVSRGTFYFHYADIYDLLHQIQKYELEQLHTLMDRLLPELDKGETPESMVLLFNYLKENETSCRALFGPYADSDFSAQVKSIMAERFLGYLHPDDTDERKRYLTDFAVNGVFGNVHAWVGANLVTPPEVMADITWEGIRSIQKIL